MTALPQDQSRNQLFPCDAGLEELYPTADFLERDCYATVPRKSSSLRCGASMARRVLTEYTKTVRDKGLLLEPVDIKKDLYGFVYARSGITLASTIFPERSCVPPVVTYRATRFQ